MRKKPYHAIVSIIFLSCLLTGCVSTKNTVYFSDIPSDDPRVKLADYHEPIVQVDDILHITVHTIDANAPSAINDLSSTNAPSASAQTPPSGYLVDDNGQVSIPMLGTFDVVGLTTAEVRKLITKEASRIFNNPTVQVRFANFKVTVIGEVAKPATYTVPNEKVTLMDALGMAGDLTVYGKRENVLLVRDNDGEKEFVRFNLNSYETFTSPHFYLKQNDVIYVEPGKGKVAATNMARTQIISITATVVSLLTVVITRLF